MNAAVVVALLAAAASPEGVVYDGAFWKQWSDGKAEVDTYKLKQSRYGEARDGVVVAVFVTEPWSAAKLVKDDAAAGGDRLNVLKLHTLSSFQTGIYDYHMATSAFVALQPLRGLAPGGVLKVAFSSQEWCGQVYHEVVDDGRDSSEVIRSYFAGESAVRPVARESGPVLVEDALMLWARGLSGPTLPLPTTTTTVRFQSSLERSRLSHTPVARVDATVSHVAHGSVVVPAGRFVGDSYRIVAGDRTIDVVVERGGARRVLKVESKDASLELVKTDRLPYWQMTKRSDDAARAALGLAPTPVIKD
ncbi:MAG: hypothetical protein Q8O67_25030 [Deltaproteobacteria bacterium]|nr:hypothetical protein [Deltaproteobacteria bacterium]